MWMTKKISLSYALIFLTVPVAFAGLLFFSQEISKGVVSGLLLCGRMLIPSLFVFLCFCEWGCLSGNFEKFSLLFQPMFRLVMGRFYRGATALLLCLIGGYPMGATALKTLEEKGYISSRQLKFLALWIFCPSPSFVITGVGLGMLHSLRIGVILWVSCALSCMVTGAVLCRLIPAKKYEERPFVSCVQSDSQPLINGISNAVTKMLQICGVVTLVAGVLGGVAQMSLPPVIQKSAYLFLEVTNGTSYLTQNGGSMAQIGAVLMFGGIGTHLQCKMLLGQRAPSYIPYFLVRIAQTVLCYCICNLFCLWFPDAVTTLSNTTSTAWGNFSVVPSLWLMGTCFVFLCSVHQMPFGRRDNV